MSFCAQLLRDAVQIQADESQTRANMVLTSNAYRTNAQFLDQIVFHDAFSAIINNIKPMPPAPQSYALQTSPITTSYSRMSAINREDLLSETTDHTEENDDDNDDDDDDEHSDNESGSDDEDIKPPGSSSDHHRRCQEDLTRYNHPYIMGHKRSLWASIQTDTKRPIVLDSQQSTQDILHPPMADLATPEPYQMRTPPAKSPSRDSVSATRCEKARALAEKKSLNLLTANSCHSRRQVTR